MSERTIQRRHHVGRRAIVKALASAEPPERKRINREPAALNGLHGYIDAMIDADPKIATAAIWQRLADEHHATVAYYTLRTYVVSRRTATKAAAGPPPTGPESMTKPLLKPPPGQAGWQTADSLSAT